MHKKIYSYTTLDESEYGSQVFFENLQKCRKKHREYMNQCGDVIDESPFEWAMDDQQNWITWQSSLLPDFPEDKLGDVAEVYFCDLEVEHSETKEVRTTHLIQISYFDNLHPDAEEGLSSATDFYDLHGYREDE